MDINQIIDAAVNDALYELREPLAKEIKKHILKCMAKEPKDNPNPKFAIGHISVEELGKMLGL